MCEFVQSVMQNRRTKFNENVVTAGYENVKLSSTKHNWSKFEEFPFSAGTFTQTQKLISQQ